MSGSWNIYFDFLIVIIVSHGPRHFSRLVGKYCISTNGFKPHSARLFHSSTPGRVPKDASVQNSVQISAD